MQVKNHSHLFLAERYRTRPIDVREHPVAGFRELFPQHFINTQCIKSPYQKIFNVEQQRCVPFAEKWL